VGGEWWLPKGIKIAKNLKGWWGWVDLFAQEQLWFGLAAAGDGSRLLG
jgi:hypothetical protein